jgi:hypothetical protein
MPFDPMSAGVAAAGLVLDFIKNQQAKKSAEANQAFQQQNLADALNAARTGQASSMRAAGGLRLDQFGNATYYDPNQGRWITSFSPTQQRLIDEGEARQGRAQTRGRQASEDYDRLRGEYLYQKPKSEAESYAEIINLLNEAQGTGERQLDTLMNRWGVRTAGNLPQLTQMDRGPTPSQQLAETMLKARGAALDESLKRKAGHTSEYLPALKQFEDTANYVAPLDPTGSGIIGMQQSGIQDILKTGSDYDKLLATLSVSGGRNVGSAYDSATKAAGGGPGASDFLNFAKMLMPTVDKTKGTVGSTTGARASSSGGDDDGIGNWDRRYSFGPTTRGVGSEAAPFGGARAGDYSSNDPFDIGTYGVPDYGLTRAPGIAADYSDGYYKNPFGAWQF